MSSFRARTLLRSSSSSSLIESDPRASVYDHDVIITITIIVIIIVVVVVVIIIITIIIIIIIIIVVVVVVVVIVIVFFLASQRLPFLFAADVAAGDNGGAVRSVARVDE